jgi:hypothetical protein
VKEGGIRELATLYDQGAREVFSSNQKLTAGAYFYTAFWNSLIRFIHVNDCSFIAMGSKQDLRVLQTRTHHISDTVRHSSILAY